jgi:hypothetical protein
VFVGGHWNRDEGREPIEVVEAGTDGFRADQLESHVGYAADIDLRSGAKLCGVIVAVSATSLIIEPWDSTIHATNGELLTLAIDSVTRISIP